MKYIYNPKLNPFQIYEDMEENMSNRHRAYKKTHTSRHHRKPTSIGGKTNARNCINLPVYLHNAWHALFQNFTPDKIVFMINNYFLDPDYELVLRKK